MALTWLIILLLILINALYVSAEFGAVSARRSRIQQLAEEGDRRATHLLRFIESPRDLDRYIAACQIGITWSSLVLGAYSQATLTWRLGPVLEEWAGLPSVAALSAAAFAVLIVITTAQVLFGELIPKSAALQYPAQAALYTVTAMRVSIWLYAWFLALLNGSGLAILRLLGFSHVSHRHIHSPDEIELLLAESRDGGVLHPDEHRRFHRALRLASRPVRQLMVPRKHVAAINADAEPDEVLRQITEVRYTRLPVYRGEPGNIVGMLHTKDLVLRYLEDGRIPRISDVMRPVVVIPESVTADRLLTLLRERHSHQAVVVDEFGMTGLVTLGDVLAELLGEVSGEFKVGQLSPEVLPDGRVRLWGLTRLDEAGHWTGAPWTGKADTVGGHVVNTLGRVPEAGEAVVVDGIEVEIERVTPQAVSSVLVHPLVRPEPGGRR
ncbi:MAG: hemolysin family protein [Bryobacteraceae bacterium]